MSQDAHSDRVARMKSPTLIQPLAWIGIGLLLLAAFGIAASVQSLSWQIQTRLLYVKGSCRVVAAEIVKVANSYELRIAHEVLIEGRGLGRTENTEQYTPSYNTRQEAEESIAKYSVGSVHPCWYYVKDPARSSVLVDRSMDTWTQAAVLCISLILGSIGAKLIFRTRPAPSQVQR